MIDTNEQHKKEANNLICLKMTRHYVDDQYPHKVLSWMAKMYKEQDHDDCVIRAIHSVINSIITQERIHFVLTRKLIIDLVKTDKNHKKHTFSKDAYKAVLFKLHRLGFIKKNMETDKDKAASYELIQPDILAYFTTGIDIEAQKQQTIDFINDYENGRKSGRKSGLEDSNKKLALSKLAYSKLDKEEEKSSTDKKIIKEQTTNTINSLITKEEQIKEYFNKIIHYYILGENNSRIYTDNKYEEILSWLIANYDNYNYVTKFEGILTQSMKFGFISLKQHDFVRDILMKMVPTETEVED